MVGPESHVALGGSSLTLGYRLDSLNRTDFVLLPQQLLSLSIQLTFLEEEDGTESLVGTKELSPTTQWNQVIFECGLMVRGGVYHIRLMDKGAESGINDIYVYIETYNAKVLESHNTVRMRVNYPTIDFDVPHRLEAYTPNVLISFGLTKSLCPPLRPLPPTVLLLARNSGEEVAEGHRGHHTASVLLEDPFIKLEREGRVSVVVKCQLWSRNSSYRVEIREKVQKRKLIAKSWTIKVDWSWKFGLNIGKTSVVPCRRNVRVTLSYPDCVLQGKDKVRVYGYESSTVPSLLAPRRQSYIAERQIQSNGTDGKNLLFPCSLFPQRFSKYCFQYVNTAEDDSVAVIMESCIPTFPPQKFTDGGWGSWSEWSECSASCGEDGKRFRYRFCDSPQPSFGGNFCEGSSIEEKPCTNSSEGGMTLPTCPTIPPTITTTLTLTPPQQQPPHNDNDSPEVEYPLKHEDGDKGGFWRDGHHSEEQRNKGIPTSGCECGCILQDLIPGFNYTLVISLTSNHSTCEDEDEEEHHNLRWILHTRGAKDRIRFQILAAAARCVVLTFRDGNTSDSNLLQLITAPFLTRTNQTTTIIESTGTSLSIGAADEMNENCSLPSMYFFGFYDIVPPPPPDLGDQFLSWKEFWTFLLLKCSLLLFLVVACVSLLTGCAKKVYDYKELKWSGGELDEEEGGMSYTSTSRTTSVTLMPFDHTYLRRLRLKHFLLRPPKLNLISTHVKSLPNTPNCKRRRMKLIPKGKEPLRGDQNLLLKSISLSDTNLDRHRQIVEPSQEVKTTADPGPSKVVLTSSKKVATPSTSTDLTPRIRRRVVEDSTSYTGSEINSMNDLEMDYYDYDIQNAGNIPGSYLLEPSFVFWTDPLMMDQSLSDNADQGIELLNTSTSMGGTTSSSIGLFTPEPPSSHRDNSDFGIKETSFDGSFLDTVDGYKIKFADEEDDDDDEGETRTISDSVGERQSFLAPT